MLYIKLKIDYFGQFYHKEINLEPGINLIYGENEAGKSTLHAFIRGMLFGIERLRGRGSASREDLYTRYLPWDYPGAFGGSMELRIRDRQYRLTRSFRTNSKSFTVHDLSTGREVKLKEESISELLPGLTEAAFRNTVSIEQLKAHTDGALAVQVRNYIANLSVAKSQEVNVAKAVSTLRSLEKQYDPARKAAALRSLEEEIGNRKADEARLDELTVQRKELLARERELTRRKEVREASRDADMVKQMEQLPAILEKYHAYQELGRQAKELEPQYEALKEKAIPLEREAGEEQALEMDRNAAEELQEKLLTLEKQEPELLCEKDKVKAAGRKAGRISILTAAVLGVILLAATGGKTYGILSALAVLGLGALAYLIVSNRTKKAGRELARREEAFYKNKSSVQKELEAIFKKHRVQDGRELKDKQGALLKGAYELDNMKRQLLELGKRRDAIQDNTDAIYETIMRYLRYFLPEEEPAEHDSRRDTSGFEASLTAELEGYGSSKDIPTGSVFPEDELTDRTMERLQETIRLRKQEDRDNREQLDREYTECRLKIERLRGEIPTLEDNEGKLMEAQQHYRELERELSEDAVELEAIRLALTSIQELSAEIHDSFGQELNRAVSGVIAKVTGRKYQDLKLDEGLEVKVGWNGNYILPEQLSAGTIDQVYFALRMAVADLLLGKDEIPMLLDDTFALYDDRREKAALTEIAKRSQTLLFTCHTREQRLLEELGLPYHAVNL